MTWRGGDLSDVERGGPQGPGGGYLRDVEWGDLSDVGRGDLSDVERGDLSDVERGDLSDVEWGDFSDVERGASVTWRVGDLLHGQQLVFSNTLAEAC